MLTVCSDRGSSEAPGRKKDFEERVNYAVSISMKLNFHKKLTPRGDEHRHDQPVNGNDTSHDDGDDGLHDELRAHDGHGGDTDSTLGGSVSGTEGCEGKKKEGKKRKERFYSVYGVRGVRQRVEWQRGWEEEKRGRHSFHFRE